MPYGPRLLADWDGQGPCALGAGGAGARILRFELYRERGD
jgi:hypothetical protein